MNPTGDVIFSSLSSIKSVEGPETLSTMQTVASTKSLSATVPTQDVVSLSFEAEESKKIQGWVKELKAMPDFSINDLQSIKATLESQLASSQVIRSVAQKIGEELYFLN